MTPWQYWLSIIIWRLLVEVQSNNHWITRSVTLSSTYVSTCLQNCKLKFHGNKIQASHTNINQKDIDIVWWHYKQEQKNSNMLTKCIDEYHTQENRTKYNLIYKSTVLNQPQITFLTHPQSLKHRKHTHSKY